MKRTSIVAIVAAVVVVLGAGYAGATAWSGQQIEARHRDYIERVQAQAPFLRLAEQSYQKGFASSTSRTTFEIGCGGASSAAAGGTAAAPRLVLDETIRHGPLAGGSVAAAVIEARLGLAGPGSEKTLAMFSGPPLAARTVVDFAGNATSTVTGAPAKATLADGAEVAWQGLSGTVAIGGDMRGFSYRLKSPGASVTDARRGLTMRMAGLEVQADGSYVGAGSRLGVGKGQGGVDAIELRAALPPFGDTPAQPFVVALAGLKFATETSLSGELMRQTTTLTGAADLNGAKVERFEMQATLRNLHAPTYQKLMERFSSLPGCEPAAAQPTPARLLADMQADLLAMARFDPALSLDKLTVEHAGKRAELSYALALQGVTAADAALPPMALLTTRGHATAAMRVPVAWIRALSEQAASRMQGALPPPDAVETMIDSGVDAGYLVRDGDDVKSSVEFAAGAMSVNGKPLPRPGAPGAPGARPKRR